MLRIGALVSGGGTNLQAILDAIHSGRIPQAVMEVVIANKPRAFALERAARAGVETRVMRSKQFSDRSDYDVALREAFRSRGVDLIVLAGFMAILGPSFFEGYEHRVMNIHPALIPAFSGPGFYGLKVHEAVLAYGCKVTGASVHFVTPEVDAGPLIIQQAVNVHPEDTPETLQRRVLETAEWKIYPQAVRLFAQGRLRVRGRQVIIQGAQPEHRSE